MKEEKKQCLHCKQEKCKENIKCTGPIGSICKTCCETKRWSSWQIIKFIRVGIDRRVEDFDVDYVNTLPMLLREQARGAYQAFIRESRSLVVDPGA